MDTNQHQQTLKDEINKVGCLVHLDKTSNWPNRFCGTETVKQLCPGIALWQHVKLSPM